MNTKKSRILWLVLLVLCLSAAITVAAFASDGTTTDEAVNNTSAATESTETESGIDVSTLGEPVKTWDISDTADDNVEANLYNDPKNVGYYILVISGTGNMKNFSSSMEWSAYTSTLKTVCIENGVTNIGDGAFKNCRYIEKVFLPDGLTTIGDWSFSGCYKIQRITFPASLTKIESRAFNICYNIVDITFLSSSVDIQTMAFYGCSGVKNCYATDILTWCTEMKFSGSDSNPLYYADNFYIDGKLVEHLNIVTDKNGISIVDKAFCGYVGLKSVTISSGVFSIGASAFYGCKNLQTVSIANTIDSIGYDAFYNCTNLKSVIIDSTDIAAGLTAADVYGKLINRAETIAIPMDIEYIGSYVLKNFTHVTPVTYDGVEYNVYSKAELGYNISSAYLQLTDDINVVYRTHIPEGYTDPYMEFVMNGVTYTVMDFTLDTEGRYCFGFMDIAPHKMSENISATVYANWNGMKVGVCKAEYSVKEYFEYILTAHADNADMVTMVSDLLIYGEKAQIFAGNSSDLVTDGLEDKLSGSEFVELDESVNKLGLNGEASENAKWASAALRLENEMAVKLGFVASDIEGLTVEVTINGRTTVYDVSELTLAENGRYYIFFRGIMAYEFDDEITAVFMQNGVQIGQTLTYSVNSYIYNSQSSDVEALADLVKSIYNYGASAKKYKGN